MSPERIQGGAYSVKSDVWSLGITLQELALGRFPFPPEGKALAVFELLQFIVNEPLAELPEGTQFSENLRAIIRRCLLKDPNARPTPAELMEDPFVQWAVAEKVDLEKWAKSIKGGSS